MGIRGTKVFSDVDKSKNSRLSSYEGKFFVKSRSGFCRGNS